MRYTISPATLDRREIGDSKSEHGSIRFGDVLFHLIDEPRRSGAAQIARGRGAALKHLPHDTSRARLHLVVQKGRLFQQEHPKVPVLLDKGRFLVVDLDRRTAKKWDQAHRPCFAIRPLSDAAVAFDARAPRASRSAALPWVQALVDSISRTAFEADLNDLVAFPTRHASSSHYGVAAKLAKTRLSQLGFDARLQTITVNNRPSFNVIADKAGQGPTPRGVVIVGAHLDSINISGGPAAPAPGADDDGSGSAGVLSIARAMKDHKAVHDLRLILFGGEEEGLLGSGQYVASLSAAKRKLIHAVVHMDMIATLNTSKPTVLLEGAVLSQSVIDGLADAAATYSQLNVQTSLHPFNSDHVSFLDAMIPAVLTIEGTDDANHNIHTANDTLAHLDFDLALEILRMNVAFVAQAIGKMP